jgi:crossover junction endodeoxyribonuclease RuvC
MVVTTANNSIIGIGVDQGIANCGYSVVELTEQNEIRILTSGTIKTSSKHELSKRITLIYKTVQALSNQYNVNILGCEKLFFSPNQKSTTNAKGRNKSASIVYTNMATGVLYLIAGENDLHLKEFVPGTVKKYVAGHGRASKEEVEEAVKNLVQNFEIVISSEHEADAIAIAITAVKFKKDLMEKGMEREEKPKRKKAPTKKVETIPEEEKPKRKRATTKKVETVSEEEKPIRKTRKKKGEVEL